MTGSGAPGVAARSADVRRAWRGLFVAALVVVLILALRPVAAEPDWFDNADKVRHIAAFVVLTLLGGRAGLRPFWLLAAGLVLFGVAIEIAQGFTPTREPSVADVAGDAVGILIGGVLQRFVR